MITQEQMVTLQSIDETTLAKMISETVMKIAQVKKNRGVNKEMIESKLGQENDYVKMVESVGKARKEANLRKAQILSDSTGKDLLEKKDELNSQLKEFKQEMAAQLEIYWEKTHKDEVTLASGTKLRIKKRFEVASGQLSLL